MKVSEPVNGWQANCWGFITRKQAAADYLAMGSALEIQRVRVPSCQFSVVVSDHKVFEEPYIVSVIKSRRFGDLEVSVSDDGGIRMVQADIQIDIPSDQVKDVMERVITVADQIKTQQSHQPDDARELN